EQFNSCGKLYNYSDRDRRRGNQNNDIQFNSKPAPNDHRGYANNHSQRRHLYEFCFGDDADGNFWSFDLLYNERVKPYSILDPLYRGDDLNEQCDCKGEGVQERI